MNKIILSISFLFFTTLATAQKSISVADFGAIPGDTINDKQAIQKAIDFCKINDIHNLQIPAGNYRISDTAAVRLKKDGLTGKLGKNPQDVLFTPYYPYAKGVSFKGVKKLMVDAEGAWFIAEGWMEPVSIEYCSEITIKGLTIDYSDNPHTEGVIFNTNKEYFDVKFKDDYATDKPMFMTRIMFWDTIKNRLFGSSIYFPKKQEWLSKNELRIWANYPHDLTGSVALINHSFHYRPAILINEAENTILERVTIHAQPGMGIVGHRSTNILMQGLRVVPRAGKYQSTNTDATHFTSCKGTIRFDGCMFQGQGDDATNVHGYYHDVTAKISLNTYQIELDKKFTTHAGVLDFPDKGDIMELVSKEDLSIIDSFTVIKVDTFPKQWKSHITLNKSLPENIENYQIINVTRLPKLEFVNSHVGSHLARAVLVKTRNVLIENNVFRESTGTAVHIGAEGDWREGAGSKNVIIRNNYFINCGMGDGKNGNASAIAINVKASNITKAGIHQNIVIDGNIIKADPEYPSNGIFISGAENVTVKNNQFSNCTQPWMVQYSENVQFYNNLNNGKSVKEEE